MLEILDAAPTRVAFNSRWFGEMPAFKLIEIAARYRVARMLERDVLRAGIPTGSTRCRGSLGNHIGITEAAGSGSMLGTITSISQITSISEDLGWRDLELLSFGGWDIAALRRMTAKGSQSAGRQFELPREIVARLRGAGAADAARRDFIAWLSEAG